MFALKCYVCPRLTIRIQADGYVRQHHFVHQRSHSFSYADEFKTGQFLPNSARDIGMKTSMLGLGSFSTLQAAAPPSHHPAPPTAETNKAKAAEGGGSRAGLAPARSLGPAGLTPAQQAEAYRLIAMHNGELLP